MGHVDFGSAEDRGTGADRNPQGVLLPSFERASAPEQPLRSHGTSEVTLNPEKNKAAEVKDKTDLVPGTFEQSAPLEAGSTISESYDFDDEEDSVKPEQF
jgi:hypothetical protein